MIQADHDITKVIRDVFQLLHIPFELWSVFSVSLILFSKYLVHRIICSFFDELFWKLRIFIFVLVVGKENKIGKALSDLKKTGVAVIPKFYSDNEVLKIKKECIKQLDELPFEKLATNENIENLMNANIESLLSIHGVKSLPWGSVAGCPSIQAGSFAH